jgi:hypothetical protein
VETEKIEFEITATFGYLPKDAGGHYFHITTSRSFENPFQALAWAVIEYGTKAVVTAQWRDFENTLCTMMRYPDHDVYQARLPCEACI